MSFRTQIARSRRLAEGLDPRVHAHAFALMGWAWVSRGSLLIHQGRRTPAQQDALYASGRTVPGPIKTHARAGESYHNYGLAFDVVFMDFHGSPLWNETPWDDIGEFGQRIGLEWGGTWPESKTDRPHFHLPLAHWTVLQDVAPDGVIPASWSPNPCVSERIK